MNAFSPLPAAIFALFCALSLTNCKEAEQLQADHKAALENLAAKRAEYESLEQKLVDLRKAVPPSSSPLESARRMTAALQNELELLDQQLATAAKDHDEAQAVLKKMSEQTSQIKKELLR